jgi:hypothetical protein
LTFICESSDGLTHQYPYAFERDDDIGACKMMLLFRRIQQSLVLLTLAIGFDFCLAIDARGQAFDQNGTATIPYPENGALIGQGVIMSSGVAASNVCIVGQETSMNPGGDPPQVTMISIRDNKDASSFFQQTGVSAAAQVKFLVGGADAKASYISSHQFSSTLSTVSVYATVEQRKYIVPAGIALDDKSAKPDLKASGGIRLTDDALKLLNKHDYETFHRECGEAFIAVLIQGAELTATITVHDLDEADSSNIQLTAHVDAFGAGVSTTLENTLKNTSSGHAFTMDFMQSGGSGAVNPTDEASVLAAVKALPDLAKKAPYTFHVIVRDYHSLPNWPKNIPPFGQADSLTQLMTTYWRLDALMRQADAAQTFTDFRTNPAAALREVEYLLGFNNTDRSTLRALYDLMSARRSILAQQAVKCYEDQTKCNVPFPSSIDLYKLAVKLPLPLGLTPATRDYLSNLHSSAIVINSFNQAKYNLYQTAVQTMNTNGGTCYDRDHYITQTFEASGYPANVAGPLKAFSDFQDALPQRLKDEAIDYYVRQPAKFRCQQSPFDPDCKLTESDFQTIGDSIVVSGAKITTNFDPDQSDRYGHCPGGNFLNDSTIIREQWPPSPYK